MCNQKLITNISDIIYNSYGYLKVICISLCQAVRKKVKLKMPFLRLLEYSLNGKLSTIKFFS